MFEKEIEKDKQDKLAQKLVNEPIIAKSGIFIVYADYVQCLNPKKTTTEIKNKTKKLLEYCLKNSKEDMTIKKYRDFFKKRSNKPNDDSIRKYFTYLNDDMRTFLGIDFDFLSNDGTNGEWEICVNNP